MKIIALDPGGTTGIAVGIDGELIETLQLAPEATADWLAIELLRTPRTDLIVCETFTISASTLKKTRTGSNTAIELIGIIKYLARVNDVPTMFQSPGEAMAFSSREKMKLVGWDAERDHARTAAQHLLLACVISGEITPESVVPQDMV